MTDEAGTTSNRDERMAALRAELDALEAEASEDVTETLDEAVDTADEQLQEVAEEAAEQIEEATGETLTPDDVRILKGLIAAKVAEDTAPEVVIDLSPPEEVVAEAIVDEAIEEDSAPIRSHWSERSVF